MTVNIFTLIIVCAILLDYFLDLISNLFNISALKLEVPVLLSGIFNAGEYKRSQCYTADNTRFSIIKDTVNIIILLVFWFLGGFNYWDIIVRSWGFNSIVSGLLYIGILGLAYSIISLPFDIYHTFVIEERYGFNRTTPKTFILDMVKGFALSILIGGLLLAAVLSLFEYAGIFAWVYCWIAVSVFSLLIEYIAPNWIMPLFNKFKPMEDGELKTAILEYTKKVNFPVKNLFVMDGSRRSSKSNAFFTGFGNSKRIALFDTLIAQHTVPELVSVLAHEVGHYKKKHILQGLLIAIIHMGIVFFLMSVFIGNSELYKAFFMAQPSIYTGLLFFGLLYTPLELVLGIFMGMLSRKNEYEADRYAVQTAGNKETMVNALKKLAGTNMSNLTPHPFYVFLHYSHPPLYQRITAIMKT
jgi:STE24 endopeptidase